MESSKLCVGFRELNVDRADALRSDALTPGWVLGLVLVLRVLRLGLIPALLLVACVLKSLLLRLESREESVFKFEVSNDVDFNPEFSFETVDCVLSKPVFKEMQIIF